MSLIFKYPGTICIFKTRYVYFFYCHKVFKVSASNLVIFTKPSTLQISITFTYISSHVSFSGKHNSHLSAAKYKTAFCILTELALHKMRKRKYETKQ